MKPGPNPNTLLEKLFSPIAFVIVFSLIIVAILLNTDFNSSLAFEFLAGAGILSMLVVLLFLRKGGS